MRTLALATMIGMLICIPREVAGDQTNAQAGPEAMAMSAASADGMDGFWDFIHRLSGPRFRGPGLTFATGRLTGSPPDYRGIWRVRLSATYYQHKHDGYISASTPPDTASMRMSTGELAVELGYRPFKVGPIYVIPEIGVAGAVHRFSAKNNAINDFNHFSFPLFAQLRIPVFSWVTVKARGGLRFFPPFPNDAFTPMTNVVGGDWEKPRFASFGLQIHR